MEPITNEIIQENSSIVVRRVISEDTSEKVRYALESVVALGSGRNAYIEGYRVGGKTGTAQKVENGVYLVGNYILSFIGFLPADDPEIIVYIAIDNAKGVTQYGGTIAAPIAKQVLLDAITALGIQKRSDGMEKEYNYNDKKYIEVPNVVGMNVEDAIKSLKSFKVEFSGSGQKVSYQTPSVGERILEGETVKIMLTD